MRKKTLYKIGELTSKLNITPRTIRYYDEIGLLPNQKRSDGDTRLFDNDDIETIKKIRFLQQTEFLPLEHIKFKLFPKTLEKNKICLFVDSLTKKDLQLNQDIPVLDFNQEKLQSELEDDLTRFILTQTQKTYFISFHSHIKLNTALNNVKKLLPKHISYIHFSTTSMGFSMQLIYKKAEELIQKQVSIEEFTSIIDRHLNLSFNICICDRLSHFFEEITTSPYYWRHLVQSSAPIFFSDHSHTRLCSYINDKSNTSNTLYDLFEEEFIKSKRYFDTIMIYQSNMQHHCEELKEKILTVFPKLTINIEEKKMSDQYGHSYIILSLI